MRDPVMSLLREAVRAEISNAFGAHQHGLWQVSLEMAALTISQPDNPTTDYLRIADYLSASRRPWDTRAD